MALIAVETNYTAGVTNLRAWPSGSSSNSVLLVESPTGRYTGTLDDAYGTIWYAFEGAVAPVSWANPKRVFDLNLAKVANAANAGGVITVSQPVSTDGNLIYPIVIGEDYLATNGRAFEWTIPAIAGFSVASSTCTFGGKYVADAITHSWLVTGTVSDVGSGQWKLSYNLPKTATQALVAAYYVWSVEIAQSGTEITRVRAGKNVQLMEKQT